MLTFFAISVLAGALTVLAPCILPLLPVVIGSSAAGRSPLTPYIVVVSLGVSIIIFTFLLKVSTALIAIPPSFWMYFSGAILIFFGSTLLFPALWDKIPGVRRLSIGSNKLVGEGHQRHSLGGDILIGSALGPVFATCSPTYFVILASVLPASFLLGTLYLVGYVLGLSFVLLLIAVLGERFVSRLSGLSDPRGWFKKTLGLLFIFLGIVIALGLDKTFQTYLLDQGYFDVTTIEQKLLEKTEPTDNGTRTLNGTQKNEGTPYIEIVNPSDFVNTNDRPITIGQYVGEKVILLDIMTYSCINCQRTFPYVTSWYETYKDDGFIVIGIHTPEFAFEKVKANVEQAMAEFGINFPVVLDNDYATWNAYGNRYWPRKYLIDIHGNIVYDHIGEGAYAETEKKIKELLKERAEVLGVALSTDSSLAADSIAGTQVAARSPETYFGALRNERLANGTRGRSGEQTFQPVSGPSSNFLYLGGTWSITGEYAAAVSEATVTYRYNAGEVYIVAESENGGTIEVWQDGEMVSSAAGMDVESGVVNVEASRLYKLVKNDTPGEHTLELRVSPGVKLFAFTFG